MLNTWIEIYQIRNAATVHHVDEFYRSHAIKFIINADRRKPYKTKTRSLQFDIHGQSLNLGAKGLSERI